MDVYDRLYELLEEGKDDPDPVTVGKYELRRILENSGAAEEVAERFEKEYEESIGHFASGLQSGKPKRNHDQDSRCNDPSGTEPDGYVGNDGSSWHEVPGGQCRRLGGNEWDLGIG